MKEIKAYIKPHKLPSVTQALKKVEHLGGMTVVNVKGFGRRSKNDEIHPIVDDLMDFAPYVKIEIFCHDRFLEEIVSLIDKNAFTGLRGDGKIYVSNVEKEIKIGKGSK